ncbi:MAG: hypothetical protein KAI50_04680 [Desulfobacterales bacterium]|nr:hypothetical protein [Desulfobacterales bacterium]
MPLRSIRNASKVCSPASSRMLVICTNSTMEAPHPGSSAATRVTPVQTIATKAAMQLNMVWRNMMDTTFLLGLTMIYGMGINK